MTSVLLLAACWNPPEEVTLTGRVLLSPDEDAAAASDASVSTRDANQEPYATATAGANGGFEVPVAANQAWYLVAAGAGAVPTASSGIAGSTDLDAPDGAIWTRSEADQDAIRAEFAGCAGADSDGGVVEGEVRLYLGGVDPDDLPLATAAWVTLWDRNEVEYAACYLDDEGTFDPDAQFTGATGRFAVFGLPEGAILAEVDWSAGEGDLDHEAVRYYGWLPGDGTFPIYPAWVTLTD